jgi:HSP20 family molecular chaperone IbpA
MSQLFSPWWGMTFVSWQDKSVDKERHYLCSYDDTYRLEILMPGFEKKEVSVSVNGDRLAVVGKMTRWDDTEIVFSEEFSIPSDINFNDIKSVLHNGILTVIMTKAEITKPRKIDIAVE